jgi:Ca-activated chloride channel family protein
MKDTFTVVGKLTVLGACLAGLFFLSEFSRLAVPNLVSWGFSVGEAMLAKPLVIPHLSPPSPLAAIPNFYHQSGQNSKKHQKTHHGVTVSTKLGSDAFNQTGYLLVTLAADQNVALQPTTDVPLNVAIVVDRSGSMQGEKLESVKKALLNVAGMFSERDQVSLIVYDDHVQTLHSGAFDRTSFEKLVANITSGGSTNLEGGLKQGLQQVSQHTSVLEYRPQPNTINHVLLLSDGLANVGVDSPEGLASLVKQYREEGLTVSTVGVGSDYDENIMTSVAKAGQGKYYFMESPSQAEQIFSDELNLLASVVAREIEVDLNLDSPFRVKRGVGYELSSPQVFNPHDLSAGNQASYLFELEADTTRTGHVNLGTIKTTYFNVTTNRTETIEVPVSVELSSQEINPLSDNEVYQEFMRSHVAEQLWQVDHYLEEVNNDQARQVLNSAVSELESAAQRLPNAFNDELSRTRSKQVYLEAQGDRDIKSEASGRSFKKLNQADSYTVQYNR